LSDIDWKEKCRKVAEWMNELGHVQGIKAPPGKYRSEESNDHGVSKTWPAYDSDDAAAWRLSCWLDSTDGEYLYWKPSRHYGLTPFITYGKAGVSDYRVDVTTHTRDRKKAQILLAEYWINKSLASRQNTTPNTTPTENSNTTPENGRPENASSTAANGDSGEGSARETSTDL